MAKFNAKSTRRKSVRLVKKFENAAKDMAWLGYGEPDEDIKTKNKYKEAITELHRWLIELEDTYVQTMNNRFPV